MPQMDWRKVDLGHLLTIGIVVGGMFISYGQYSAQLEGLRTDVQELRRQNIELIQRVAQLEGRMNR